MRLTDLHPGQWFHSPLTGEVGIVVQRTSGVEVAVHTVSTGNPHGETVRYPWSTVVGREVEIVTPPSTHHESPSTVDDLPFDGDELRDCSTAWDDQQIERDGFHDDRPR